MFEYSDAQRKFLAQLWEISTELHDYCAKRFRDGASLEAVKLELKHATEIRN